MLIKICGITNIDDALMAVESGANALGFVFYPGSPRYIEPRFADRIIARLPSEVLSVGVFVVNSNERLPEGDWHALQLHGLQDEGQIPETQKRVFVATSPNGMSRFPNSEIIVDESRGTGRQTDWNRLRELDRPFILSGGLTPENVGGAVAMLKPAGVDVSSGVEMKPGLKDSRKVKRFIENVNKALAKTLAAE